MHNFKNLKIWQDGMDLCDLIYNYTQTLPSSEIYNLGRQMEKCGVSIPSNISEGSGKRTNKHFNEFLSTSLSSAFELETQLLICERRKFGSTEKLIDLLIKVRDLQKKIYNFRETLLNEK
jgi:four helix bundle protein